MALQNLAPIDLIAPSSPKFRVRNKLPFLVSYSPVHLPYKAESGPA
jgi:hypothetical protein